MSVPAKDGAWVSATRVTRIECSKCGMVSTTKYPTNDRELDELIAEHVRTHGGRDRA